MLENGERRMVMGWAVEVSLVFHKMLSSPGLLRAHLFVIYGKFCAFVHDSHFDGTRCLESCRLTSPSGGGSGHRSGSASPGGTTVTHERWIRRRGVPEPCVTRLYCLAISCTLMEYMQTIGKSACSNPSAFSASLPRSDLRGGLRKEALPGPQTAQLCSMIIACQSHAPHSLWLSYTRSMRKIGISSYDTAEKVPVNLTSLARHLSFGNAHVRFQAAKSRILERNGRKERRGKKLGGNVPPKEGIRGAEKWVN